MTRLRIVPGLLMLLLGITAARPCLAQANRINKKRTIPDFDIRDAIAARAGKPQSQSAGELIGRRRVEMEQSAAALRPGLPGLRMVPNRFGLPKLLLREGATLSAPSTLEPEEAARNFLRAHNSLFPFSAAELAALRVIVKDVGANATFLAFNQTVNGVDVFNGHVKVALTKTGEVVAVSAADVIPGLQLATQPRLTAAMGARAALRACGLKGATEPTTVATPDGRIAFNNPQGARFSPITAELVIFPMDAQSARLAYRFSVETDARSWFEVLIDAQSGALLFRHNVYLAVSAQARVWTQSPMVGGRELVTLPDGWLPTAANSASKTGWVTTGNNTDTFVDLDGNDLPDNTQQSGLSLGHAYSANDVFDFPYGDGTLSEDPRQFQAASVANLFYFVNTAHDYFYGLGFTEAAGNFQTTNFGKGGKGNDPVIAEGQQGEDDDNSSFAPTAEGTSPRMRIGLMTRGTESYNDDLDSDYDGQTVIHEYGHGVSNRLVGAGTSTSCLMGIQSGAMGEGWSDYFAISFFNDPVMGAYPAQDLKTGIRRQSYEGYTFTYQDIGNGPHGYEVHDDGEIWAATLWDLRKSLGQAVTDLLVINGLKNTPCNPSMTDARDAVLAADQATNGGANRTQIWQIFARHGMGYSAQGVDGTSLSGTRYDAAYDLPPDLQTTANPSVTSDPLSISTSVGDAYTYTVTATNPNAGTLNFVLATGPAGMHLDPVTGALTWTATFTGQRVKINVTDGKGGSVVHGFELPVYTQLTAGNPVTIGGLADSLGYATITVPSGAPVLQVTLRSGTGDADLLVMQPDGFVDYSARTGNNETLSYAFPASGEWQIAVAGYQTYSAVRLESAIVTPTPLSFRTTLSGLTGVESSEAFYKLTIPAGATSFSVSTSGGNGDVDLFLKKGQPAVCQSTMEVSQDCSYDESSAVDGNNESISITNPAAGDWYVDLSAFLEYSGVTLATTIAGPATLVADAASLSFAATEGGAAPPPQSINLANLAAATSYAWSAQTATGGGGPWLSIDKTSGDADATLSVSVDPTGLKAGVYQGSITVTAAGLADSPLTIGVSFTVTAAPIVPVITSNGVLNGASFQPTISPGSWVAVLGENLSSVTDNWGNAIVDGNLPIKLDGVTVRIGGKPAFVNYVSETQINVQAPDVADGVVPVTVTNTNGTSAAVTVVVARQSPAFFLWLGKYAVATHLDYSLAVAPNTFPGALTVAAKPGEVVILWATGLGPTTPPVPAGIQVPADQTYATSDPVEVTVGDAKAHVYGAALSPGFAGLYQVAIQVPELADGDYPIKATVGGASSSDQVSLSVRH